MKTMSRTAETGEKETRICNPEFGTIHYAADLSPGTMNTAEGEFRISLHLVWITVLILKVTVGFPCAPLGFSQDDFKTQIKGQIMKEIDNLTVEAGDSLTGYQPKRHECHTEAAVASLMDALTGGTQRPELQRVAVVPPLSATFVPYQRTEDEEADEGAARGSGQGVSLGAFLAMLDNDVQDD
jgi:hypothetical protein